MLMALVLLAVLFIVGLSHTFYSFPTKKFMAWFQSLFAKTTTSKQHVPINSSAMADQKKVKAAELKSVFATFDKNDDGFITKQELEASLKNIGIYMTEKEVGDVVEKVDSNGDGLIDLDEFCELFGSAVSREEGGAAVGEGGREEEGRGGGGGGGESDLKEAFDVFDGDGDGLITVEELGLVLSSMGLKEGQRSENCKEMIRKVDMDGDGMVNFDEFKRMMKAGGRLLTVS